MKMTKNINDEGREKKYHLLLEYKKIQEKNLAFTYLMFY